MDNLWLYISLSFLEKCHLWILCLLEYGLTNLSRVRRGSNLLLVCIPNAFGTTLFHNLQAEGVGFVWIGQSSVK